MDEPRRHYAKGNKPDTKEQILYDSTQMRYLEQKLKTEWWFSGAWGGRMGSQCLNGMELQFGKMKNFWR